MIVGEGATQPPGGPHAEIEALRAAGDAARRRDRVRHPRAVLRITGRTGPCADALVDAGVARVVVAIEDPDPSVAGTGIAPAA